MKEKERIVELAKELHEIAKRTGQTLIIDNNNYSRIDIRSIRILNNWFYGGVCIRCRREEYEIEPGIKVIENDMKYIPKEEYNPEIHEEV